MSISNETSSIGYVGNGAADTFAYPFRIIDEDDLRVVEVDTDDVPTVLTIGDDYTVTDVGDADGGNVVLEEPLTNQHRLLISRVVPVTQLTEWSSNQGIFQLRTLEEALDKLTAIGQMFDRLLSARNLAQSRVLVLGEEDTDGAGTYRAKSNRIAGLSDPVGTQDAATKGYVDAAVAAGGGGFDVLTYTTATIPAATALSAPMILVKDAGEPASLWVKFPNVAETAFHYQQIAISLGG